MKKILLTLLFIPLLILVARSQVSIQSLIPPSGIVQKNQLWNVTVMNAMPSVYRATLRLSLRDRNSGMEILTAVTAAFDVTKGARQMNLTLLSPIQYNYLSGGTDTRLQGLLPAGSYLACYTLTDAVKPAVLAEECIPFDTEPLSPPMLVMPADSSLLQMAPKQFTWIPPTPAEMFDRLRYEIIITEIKEGQKANEALQDNLPFYTDGALYINNMIYPASAIALEKEKWYAWQVIAGDDKAYAGKSEAWVFKLTSDAVTPIPVTDVYLVMQDDAKGSYEISSRLLHVKYFSYSKPQEVIITFRSRAGKEVKQFKRSMKPGDNYFDFELGNSFRDNQSYSVTIEEENGKRPSLNFSIHTK